MDLRLQRYIDAVRQVAAAPLSAAGKLHGVRTAAAELLAAPVAWDPALRTLPPIGYGRNLVWRDPAADFVIIAMAWPPGIMGAPHDHGTWGVVAVLEGHVQITDYERDDDGSTADQAALREVGSIVAGPGEIATVLPPHRDFHRVGNASRSAPALSLHTYGADVRHCHVLDPVSEKLVSRRLDYTTVVSGTTAC